MPDVSTAVGAIVGALIVIGVFLVITYNRLTRLRIAVEEAWSSVTVQLKRRADLIPNLVSTVQGYATHERAVFEAVTAARAATMSAGSPGAAAEADAGLAGALKSLFAVAEAYPALQASANFLALQADLTDTEDKVQASRRFYNSGVRDYNTALSVFPTNLVAPLFKFATREFFEVADRAAVEEAPTVSF